MTILTGKVVSIEINGRLFKAVDDAAEQLRKLSDVVVPTLPKLSEAVLSLRDVPRMGEPKNRHERRAQAAQARKRKQ